MREYKFRGWDAVGDNGWVYGDLVHNQKVTETGLEPMVMVGGYEVVPESVGICTGFKDDCGNMLYEGDICRIGCYDRLFNAVIRYIDFKGCFYYNSLPIDLVLTTKLIGNVYQNKELSEKEQIDLIPEERLKEIINILLPWGYSHYDKHRYTGVSPFIGSTKNVITIVANDPEGWGSVFAICMDAFTEDEDDGNSLGFYKGAPELESKDDVFKDKSNVLDFNWAFDKVQENAFNAVVRKENTDFAFEKTEKDQPLIWHDGTAVPHTGRIMFESTHGGFRFAYYDLESDRFDSDDECYYSGKWEHCDVKRWIYEEDLSML